MEYELPESTFLKRRRRTPLGHIQESLSLQQSRNEIGPPRIRCSVKLDHRCLLEGLRIDLLTSTQTFDCGVRDHCSDTQGGYLVTRRCPFECGVPRSGKRIYERLTSPGRIPCRCRNSRRAFFSSGVTRPAEQMPLSTSCSEHGADNWNLSFPRNSGFLLDKKESRLDM
jgi:hypothetical protein